MNEVALQDLAARLTQAKDTGASVTLSAEESRIITSALLELASSQTTVALQRTLLASYDEDLQAIDRAAAGALQGLAGELQRAADARASIEPGAAQEARQALIEQIRQAHTIEHALTVVLRFAMIAGRLA
ncbi:MAG: hypothetical protein KDA20_03105 [Phycisphaerales bacterium]|nr:hypothetical protein [Phycisphaerales bacterium]